MQLKIIENIKKFIINKVKTQGQNNSKQNNLQYKRNKYGFFSLENKEKQNKINNNK
jgi:hypothetical protein